MTSTELSPTDPLHRGHMALTEGHWASALAAFETALAQKETPDALEGLGTAAWWLDDASVTFDARERAYRLYRERGDSRGAARVATALAYDYFSFRGEYAIASGWLQRARRLLDGQETSAEFGWLSIIEGHIALMADHAPATTQQLCAQAAVAGRSLGDINLEMLALAYEGLALVCQGMLGEGMRRLDEATLAAATGEMTDIDATCTTCCCLVYACERARDYERAAQWCEHLKVLATRWSYPMVFSFCRTHYAGVLLWRGFWEEAEATLLAATGDLLASRPAEAAEGIVRLADLRRRQGRAGEAAELLAQAESHPMGSHGGKLALLGRAALALDQADAAAAMDLADRFIRGLPVENQLERPAALELRALAQIALGAVDQAAETCNELQTIATTVATEPLRAAASFIEGSVAAARGQHEQARRWFEDAVDLYERSGAPFETARARIKLARALHHLGRNRVAGQEARQALNALRQLGARTEAARAADLVREIESSPRSSAAKPPVVANLSHRELDVLRLIAAGKRNQEIAVELVLSVRTVERHISNIYAKIGASGAVARATATAYALRHDLTQPPLA